MITFTNSPNPSGIVHVSYIPETDKCFIVQAASILQLHFRHGYYSTIQCTMPQTAALTMRCNVCYSPELNMYVTISQQCVLYSRDGMNWAKFASPFTTTNVNNIVWVPWEGVFVAGLNAPINKQNFIYSRNGWEWNLGWLNASAAEQSGAIISMDVSIEQKLILASTGSQVLASRDGITWCITGYIPSLTHVRYFKQKGWYASGTFNSGAMVALFSKNGLEWSTTVGVPTILTGSYSAYNNIPAYDELSGAMFFSPTTIVTGSYAIVHNYSSVINWLSKPTCKITATQALSKTSQTKYYVDDENSRFGLGIQPSFALHLSRDSAIKPTTSTWSTSSDSRLKEDIVDANIDTCLNIVENLPLKKYKWKYSTYSDDQINDRRQLGWIAQDVEAFFPKSVKKVKMHGYEDCRTLNNDQMIATMFGAIKKLINMDSDLDQYFVDA